jgi:hypothetical protein
MEREDIDWYGAGLELQDEDGWALYCGCDGEQGDFVGFFPNKETAESVAGLRDAEGEPCFPESQVVHAILTPLGIVAANDFTIGTHKQLRRAFAKATEPPTSDKSKE